MQIVSLGQNICTNFQEPRCGSSREMFHTNFPMYNNVETEGKNIKNQLHGFLSDDVFEYSQGVCKV